MDTPKTCEQVTMKGLAARASMQVCAQRNQLPRPHLGVQGRKLLMAIREGSDLRRADKSEVERVEEQHDVLALHASSSTAGTNSACWPLPQHANLPHIHFCAYALTFMRLRIRRGWVEPMTPPRANTSPCTS